MDTNKKTNKSLTTMVVIIVLIIVGLFYLWNGQSSVTTGYQQAATANVSSSDTVDSISADLYVTNAGPDMSGLDAIK